MKTNIQNWKQVSISGVTGILMGAGAMKVMQTIQSSEVDNVANNLELASSENSYDNMSFREAFDAARDKLGVGGVFRWHGNIYNTYTADEWNDKTKEEQDTFVEEVGAEISADKVDISDLSEDVDTEVSIDEVNTPDLTQAEDNIVETEEETDFDVRVALDDNKDVAVSAATEQTTESFDDVRVLGYGEVTLENGRNVTVQELDINGQRVAVVDIDQDGEADLAMSDLNDNQQMDEGEVIDLHTGEAVSFTNDACDDLTMTVDTASL